MIHNTDNNLGLGIFLEDIDILIPWNTSINELRIIANPVFQEGKDRVRVFWNDHVVLGGIQSQVEAVFYKNSAKFPDHPNSGGQLNKVFLNFYNFEKIDSREQHKRLKAHMTNTLGLPSSDGKGETPFSDLPFTEWDLNEIFVVLKVFERFGEYCVGEVRRKL